MQSGNGRDARRWWIVVIGAAVAVAALIGGLIGWSIRQWAWTWGSAAEWATGLLTGGALIFTGVAVLLQREELTHQREELREQREERERDQAARVLAWSALANPAGRTEWTAAQQPAFYRWVNPTGYSVFYWNASGQPIHHTQLVVQQPEGIEEVVPLGTVPPMQHADSVMVEMHVDATNRPAEMPVGIEFRDARNRSWRLDPERGLSRLLKPLPANRAIARSEYRADEVVNVCETCDTPPGDHCDWPAPDAPLWKLRLAMKTGVSTANPG